MSRRVNQIAVKEKQSQVTVENQIHQVSTDKVIRHNLNVGPPGPPGAGARIDGVVDTVGELPVAADPGSIWIVRPDMMHIWDEVDGWQAVGQVSIVSGPEGPRGPQGPEGPQGPSPKINDLPTRPGGPQPTDEFWLASAGGAADFKSTIAALAGAVLGNISVVEDGTRTSIRIPEARIQIVFARATQTFSNQTSRVSSFAFPEPFANTDYVPIGVSGTTPDGLETVRHDTNYTAGFMGYVQRAPANFTGQVSSYWVILGKY